MKRIHVLGIGSPFGDDQLGWNVIDRLSIYDSLQPYIPQALELKKLDRPGLSLLSYLQDVGTAIIIDAMVSDGQFGKVSRLYNEEITLSKKLMSSHHVSIPEALKLGGMLNILPKEIILYGMEIDPSRLSNSFSKEVNSFIDPLIGTIYKEIMELLTHE